MPDEAVPERGEDVAGVNSVMVFFFDGAEAGVKTGRRHFAFEDANGGRHVAVEGALPFGGRHAVFLRRIEMSHLAERVDAGVGAAGAVEGIFCRPRSRGGGLERVLDGVAAGLGLPAEERAAVVGDGQFQSHSDGERFPVRGSGFRVSCGPSVVCLALRVEIILEDDAGGGLVDDGAAVLGVPAGGVEMFLGGDGGEAFVESDELGALGEGRAQLFDEGADFFRRPCPRCRPCGAGGRACAWLGRYADATRVNQQPIKAQGFDVNKDWRGHNGRFQWCAMLMEGRATWRWRWRAPPPRTWTAPSHRR